MNAFGWDLITAQEIYEQSSEIISATTQTDGRMYADGDFSSEAQTNFVTRKNGTHFIALRFSRDMRMPNYAKVKSLENEYHENMGAMENENYGKVSKNIFMYLAGFVMMYTIPCLFAIQRLSSTIIAPLVIANLVILALYIIGTALRNGRRKRNANRRMIMKRAIAAAYKLTLRE